MISKVEYIKNVGSLKMYVRNNSLADGYERVMESIMFTSWRCGYVEFILPNGSNPSYIEDINSYNKNKSNVARKIENIIESASVHGGITYCRVDKKTRRATLGFDCNHYEDTKRFIKEPRSVGYCKTNIELLLKAIFKIKKNYRKILIKETIKKLRSK